MKGLFLSIVFLLLSISFNSTALNEPAGPVAMFIHSFCVAADECEVFIKLENRTSFAIGINARELSEKGVDINGLTIFEQDKYIDLKSDGKDVYQAKISFKKSESITRYHREIKEHEYTLVLKPYGKVEYKIQNLDTLFKFDENKSYLAQFSFLFAGVSINGKNTGFLPIRSNLSSFSIPNSNPK